MNKELLIKGIVLFSSDYKEKDKQVTIFSLESGKITAILKGCKNANAKLKFAYSPFCFAEFKLAQNGSFYTITDATLIDSFFDITKDIDVYYSSMALLEIVNHISKFDEVNIELFLLLLNSLKAICYEKITAKKVLSKFLLLVLGNIGYKLSFKVCSKCKMPFIMDKFLDLSSGEFVCNNCQNINAVKVSNVAFNNLKNINNTEILRLDTLKIDNIILNECLDILMENFECRIERKLNSHKIIKSSL